MILATVCEFACKMNFGPAKSHQNNLIGQFGKFLRTGNQDVFRGCNLNDLRLIGLPEIS